METQIVLHYALSPAIQAEHAADGRDANRNRQVTIGPDDTDPETWAVLVQALPICPSGAIEIATLGSSRTKDIAKIGLADSGPLDPAEAADLLYGHLQAHAAAIATGLREVATATRERLVGLRVSGWTGPANPSCAGSTSGSSSLAASVSAGTITVPVAGAPLRAGLARPGAAGGPAPGHPRGTAGP